MIKNRMIKIIALGLAAVFMSEVTGYDVKIRTKYDSVYYKKEEERSEKIAKAMNPVIKVVPADVNCCENECEKEANNKKFADTNIRDCRRNGSKTDFTKSLKKKHRRHRKSSEAKANAAKLSDEKVQHKYRIVPGTGTLLILKKL